jgi:V/A-type H+-transporting ATPase subunit E
MQNKLQELTEQLYNEGLAKGRQEGDRYLEEARANASRIVEDAKRQAAEIVGKAEKDAADLSAKAEADIRMASAQALQATRKDIENLIVSKAAAQDATSDPEFLRKIILAVAGNFSSESGDIALVLPESLKAELEPWVKSELAKALSKPVEASFSKKISGGFTISPKDGGYYVSFTDKTFDELIAEYLRPVTRKLLFGE